jgi:hypothetical protein
MKPYPKDIAKRGTISTQLCTYAFKLTNNNCIFKIEIQTHFHNVMPYKFHNIIRHMHIL